MSRGHAWEWTAARMSAGRNRGFALRNRVGWQRPERFRRVRVLSGKGVEAAVGRARRADWSAGALTVTLRTEAFLGLTASGFTLRVGP